MRQRDILHCRAIKSRDSCDCVLYKAARNIVVAKINYAKRDFVESATCISQANTKPKDMWRELKQFLPNKSTSTTSTHIEINGETVSDSKNMANAFNDFFCGIGHKFAEKVNNSLPEIEQLMPRGSFSIPDISVDFVKKEIQAMSNSKATGLDDIYVKLLKLSLDAIAEIFTFLLKMCLKNCEVASELKKARIIPLFQIRLTFYCKH